MKALINNPQDVVNEVLEGFSRANADLVKLYNEKFNCLRGRAYDGSHISFHGMSPEIVLREHQRNAVARILYGGNTLLAHVVGAGKTYTMAAAASQPAWRPITSITNTLVDDSAIEATSSAASRSETAVYLAADPKPGQQSVTARSLSTVFGTPMQVNG